MLIAAFGMSLYTFIMGFVDPPIHDISAAFENDEVAKAVDAAVKESDSYKDFERRMNNRRQEIIKHNHTTKNDGGLLTNYATTESLHGFATKEYVENNKPDLSGFATTDSLKQYATKDYVTDNKPDLSGFATTSYVDDYVRDHKPNLSEFVTNDSLESTLSNYQRMGGSYSKTMGGRRSGRVLQNRRRRKPRRL